MSKENEEDFELDIDDTEEGQDEQSKEGEKGEMTLEKWKAIALRRGEKLRKIGGAGDDQNQKKGSSKADPDGDFRKDIENLKVAEAKRNFGYSHNLSPAETDLIFKYTGGRAPTDEEMKSDFMTAGIDKIRAKARAEAHRPGASHNAATFEGKAYKDLSVEDKAKNYGAHGKQVMERHLARKR
jgi:hypothetical protein